MKRTCSKSGGAGSPATDGGSTSAAAASVADVNLGSKSFREFSS